MGLFDQPAYGFPMPISSQSGTGYQAYGGLHKGLLSFPNTAVINDGSRSSPATGPPNPKALQPPVIVPQMPSLAAWKGHSTQTALRPEINSVRMINLDVFDGHLVGSAGITGGLSDGLLAGSALVPQQPSWAGSNPRLANWPQHQNNPQTVAWPSVYDPTDVFQTTYSGGNSPSSWIPEYTGPRGRS